MIKIMVFILKKFIYRNCFFIELFTITISKMFNYLVMVEGKTLNSRTLFAIELPGHRSNKRSDQFFFALDDYSLAIVMLIDKEKEIRRRDGQDNPDNGNNRF